MKISQIMTTRVLAAKPNAICTSLAQKMLARVCQRTACKLVGIVSRTDILRAHIKEEFLTIRVREL